MSMSAALFVIFFALAIVGIPIAVSLGVACTIAILLYTEMPFSLIAQSIFSSMNSFIMAAVPLFILVGHLMEKGGVAEKIFNFAKAMVGWMPGGLGHVNVISSMIFGGISGSSVADIASIGRIEIWAMTQNGYSKDYSVALTLTTSALATIIPPSILMIIAGSVANQSIGLLLAAGLIPGIFIGVLFMTYNHIYTVRRGMGTPTKFDRKILWQTSRQAVPALLTPALLLWGIIGGFFTPTEAAGVAVIYTYLLSAFIYKQISWRDAPKLLFNMARTTGTILFIAITGKLAAWVFTYDSLPARAAEFLGSLDLGSTGVLVLVFLFLIIVGMFMDAVAAIFILVPVLLPAMVRIGVDPIHFIVVLVIALALGLITPPVGVCLFAAAQISDMRIERVIKASWPLFIVLSSGISAMVLFPQIILYPMQLVGMYP